VVAWPEQSPASGGGGTGQYGHGGVKSGEGTDGAE
jgi:hypothetical protein